MVNLYARDMARVETCKEAALIHALLQFADLMPEDVWFGSEMKRITGALIHDIFMQLIGPNSCTYIDSFLKRGMKIEEAILETLDVLFRKSSWFPYISSLINIENDQLLSQLILQEFITYKRGLAKLAKPLIRTQHGEIQPIQFENEVYILYSIDQNFSLAGKIDLLFNVSEKIIVVDLKTGKKNLNNQLQVQLYTEILKSEYPDKTIVGQLWYLTKDDPIIDIVDTSDSLLQKIHFVIDNLTEIKSIETLIKYKGLRRDCYYCRLCSDAQKYLSSSLQTIIADLSNNKTNTTCNQDYRELNIKLYNNSIIVGEKEIG